MWGRAVSHPSGGEWEIWGVGKRHFSLCSFPRVGLIPCCKTWGEQCFREKALSNSTDGHNSLPTAFSNSLFHSPAEMSGEGQILPPPYGSQATGEGKRWC